MRLLHPDDKIRSVSAQKAARPITMGRMRLTQRDSVPVVSLSRSHELKPKMALTLRSYKYLLLLSFHTHSISVTWPS